MSDKKIEGRSMSDKPVLYGYSASTYVRTVRAVLTDKNVDYDQIQLDVLGGETRLPEHLARHPFGKVPVLDIDGMRLRETQAICGYLNDTREGISSIPSSSKERAKMYEAIGLINGFGYPSLLGIAAYHLFPDFIGGQNDDARKNCIDQSKKLLELFMHDRGGRKFLSSEEPSLSDYFLAPIMFYVKLTPDADVVFGIDGVPDWWNAIDDVPNFKATEPQLG
jgi:glutathione S-transferase